MKLSHADFRPRRRPRYVPSSAPRRRIPVIRVVLLIALAGFVYLRFDDLWPRVRAAAAPIAERVRLPGTAQEPAAEESLPLSVSPDSSRFSLDCPGGLTEGCCRALTALQPGLCGAAEAMVEKARRVGALDTGSFPLRLEARPDGDPDLPARELASVRGGDRRGQFHFRRDPGRGNAWCDAGRGCLSGPRPLPPMAQGRMRRGKGTAVLWTSSDAATVAVLPGRVCAMDSTADGFRIRVYHGKELYTSYEPLRPAPGLRTGSEVNAGALLGEARASASGYGVLFRARQAGIQLDPSHFWDARHVLPDDS